MINFVIYYIIYIHKKVKLFAITIDIILLHRDERREKMNYSTMAHALISYMECHLENFDLKKM